MLFIVTLFIDQINDALLSKISIYTIKNPKLIWYWTLNLQEFKKDSLYMYSTQQQTPL